MSLPNEMLVSIFKYLNGKAISMCRGVSRQWKDVADSFGEDYWKQTCSQDFPDVYELAHRKSNLSWRQLYKSLSLWPKIQHAKLKTYYNELIERFLQRENDRKFIVLSNGNISYSRFTANDFTNDNDGFCNRNSICYYDAETLGPCYGNEEAALEEFEFLFDEYAENDHLIVLGTLDSSLYVIPKANKKHFKVGEYLVLDSYGDYAVKENFHLIEDDVYFRTPDKMLWVSKLVEENGDVAVKSQPCAEFQFAILAMSCINDNQVSILTYSGQIYSLIDKNIQFICNLHPINHCIASTLQCYGFEWSTNAIFKWLTSGKQDMKDARITKLKNVTVFRHGRMVILGTLRRLIHIYDNPFDRCGNLKLYTAKPTRIINLNMWYPCHPQESKQIQQIDVIEIENGHRIIILCNVVCKRLNYEFNSMMMMIGLDFIHSPGSKRGAESVEDDDNVVKRNRCNASEYSLGSP